MRGGADKGPQQLLGKHPNIVQYHDAAVRDARNGGQTVLILMELCPGPCPPAGQVTWDACT